MSFKNPIPPTARQVLDRVSPPKVAPKPRASVLECGSPLPLSYNDLKTGIEKCPITFLPSLFITIVKRCLQANVFAPKAMAKYCREEEAKQ